MIIDDRIEVYAKMGRFTPESRPSKTLQRDSEHVRILVFDALNTICEALYQLIII